MNAFSICTLAWGFGGGLWFCNAADAVRDGKAGSAVIATLLTVACVSLGLLYASRAKASSK